MSMRLPGSMVNWLLTSARRQHSTRIGRGCSPQFVFEWGSCFAGTKAIVSALKDASAYKFVGGGDSIAAVNQLKCAHYFSHISTGGGASLEFLEGAALPGLTALGYE